MYKHFYFIPFIFFSSLYSFSRENCKTSWSESWVHIKCGDIFTIYAQVENPYLSLKDFNGFQWLDEDRWEVENIDQTVLIPAYPDTVSLGELQLGNLCCYWAYKTIKSGRYTITFKRYQEQKKIHIFVIHN